MNTNRNNQTRKLEELTYEELCQLYREQAEQLRRTTQQMRVLETDDAEEG